MTSSALVTDAVVVSAYRRIAENILDRLIEQSDRAPGLRGLCGHAVVAAAAGRDDVAAVKLDLALQHSGQITGPGLWKGLSGVRWTLGNLAGGPEADAACEVFDDVLLHGLSNADWTGSHDLVNGLAGIGIGILSAPLRGHADKVASLVLTQLERTAIDEHGGFRWAEVDSSTRRRIDVAHGVGAIIAICDMFVDAGLDCERAATLRAGATRWLLEELPDSESSTRRLGWCHSDAGVALPLLTCGVHAADASAIAEALSIAREMVHRSAADVAFQDSGFCHGAAGFAHMLHLLHRATGSAAAANAARAWLGRVVEMRRPGEGVAGFPAWRPDDGGWVTVESIFEGDLGVALVLLAAIGQAAPPWEHLFALDPDPPMIPSDLVAGASTWSTGTDPTESVNGDDESIDPLADAPEAPRLIVALDCQRPMAGGLRVSLLELDEVVIGRGPHRAVTRSDRAARLFLDDTEASRRHVRLRRLPSGWELIDLGSKNGTSVNGERSATTILADGDVFEVGGTLIVFREEPADPQHLGDREIVLGTSVDTAFATLNNDLEWRFADVARIAPANVPVLIRGETGTGKEVLARAIHSRSGRSGPFIPVNCGALPRALIESELFGYRRGAFSGAKDDREGLIRKANGGTMFLDEIGELPLESQVALLRVLQDGEVRPVGSNEHISVDVRFLAATHQDLSRLIGEGRFRQDLYARLAGFVAVVRPLRERREDIGLLIGALLPRLTQQPERVALRRSAGRALLRYDYPLNVRELEQALHSATVLAGADEIRVRHLPEAIRNYVPPGSVSQLPPSDRALRETLIDAMRKHRGNVAAVGRAMGKAPMQIRRWCSRFGVDIGAFRD